MELTKAKFKKTEAGLIPEDWSLFTIEDLTPKYGKYHIVDGPFGSNLKTEHYKKKGIPIITSGYVTNGLFKAESYLYVDKEKFLQEKRSAVKGGDIVMAKIGARCGASAILPLSHQEGILSGNALKITIEEKGFSTKLIWQILFDKYQKGDLQNITTTGAQPAVSMQNLKKLKIPLPPTLTEQKAIATALSDVDEMIAKLEKLIEKKNAIKQGAMQQLLTPPHKGGKRLEGFSGEWVEIALDDIAELKNGYAFRRIDYDKKGIYNVVTIANVQQGYMDIGNANRIVSLPTDIQNHHLLSLADILISMTGNVGRICRVSSPNCLLNQRVGLIRAKMIDDEFLFQRLSFNDFTNAMILAAQGGAQPNIGKKEILGFKLFMPPSLNEQKAISEIIKSIGEEIVCLTNKLDKTIMLKQGMMQELLTGRTRLI